MIRLGCRFASVLLFLPLVGRTFAGVLYVDANALNPTPPYTNWAMAASSIQDAVDAAAAGDRIVVTNGVYATGMSVVPNVSFTRITNRVSVYKPLTLASANGPRFTIIDGGGQTRGLYLANGASLVGFTVTNGNALDGVHGGGIYCDGAATASNCVFSGNSASSGGGAYGGTFFDCVFAGNSATTNNGVSDDSGDGGGVDSATLYNCLVATNAAPGEGGGAYLSILCNCTVIGNSPDGASGYVYTFMGAYVYPSYAYNSILWSNAVSDVGICVLDHCCLSGTNGLPGWLFLYPLNPLAGCITNDPLFVDSAAGNFRLQTSSPCIDAGTNLWVGTANDLDETLRIANGTVDMGAYEHQNPSAPYFALQPAGAALTTGASQDFRVVAGGAAPLGYQWSFNGSPLDGATNSTLSLTDLRAAQSGNYQVTVFNTFGSVNSQVAVLAVTAPIPPQITIQPANQVGVPGGKVSLSVAISGPGPLTYQWRFNGTNIPNDIISTVAGNGTNGFSGDNAPANAAKLNNPVGVTVDSTGNVFIADEGNHRVRKVGTNGIITTVAGTGSPVYSGEGGAATNAALDPASVAFDTSGNLFVADQSNGGIRKIDTNGVITTVVAGLNTPSGVVVDARGNLWVADTGNNRIIVVTPNGGITTVAGNGAIRSSVLYGYDPEGFFAGDGWLATNAVLSGPLSVAVATPGNWFISDSENERVRQVDASGIITTVAGDPGFFGQGISPANSNVGGPTGICVDAWGELFFADSADQMVRKLDPFGVITTIAGNGESIYSGDGGPATNASLFSPYDVALDSHGNLYIADAGNQVIRKVTFQGPNLSLTNLGAGNIGNYDVVVTSPYGSVTSRAASVSLSGPAPVIQKVALMNGGVTLTWGTVTGLSYQVQSSATLNPANWTNLGSPVTATGSTASATDATGVSDQRFYRVFLQP